jgi:hypothetical protein
MNTEKTLLSQVVLEADPSRRRFQSWIPPEMEGKYFVGSDLQPESNVLNKTTL